MMRPAPGQMVAGPLSRDEIARVTDWAELGCLDHLAGSTPSLSGFAGDEYTP